MEENVAQVEKKEKKKLTKKQIIIIAAAAAVVVIAAIIIIAVLTNDNLKATTMRIMRLEGTVTLEQNGRVTAVKEELRLKNGNALITDSNSLVGISLDDFKNITLDELSRAEFIQKGKQLQLNLTEGALFFEVTKPLEDDETCEIHTSSMVVGIRGTSGWVRNTKDVEEVILTDGHVKIMIKNPYTGETKEVAAKGGQRVRVSFSQEMENGTSINVVVEDISEDDLNQFILDRLRENDALRAKVEADTNWSDPKIMGTMKEEPIAKAEDEKKVESDDEDDDTASAGDDDEDEAPEEEAQWRDLVTIDPNALPEGDQVQPTAETPVVYVEWFPPATEEPAAAPETQPATDPATDPSSDPGSGSGGSSGGNSGGTTGTVTTNPDGSMTATLSNGATAEYRDEGNGAVYLNVMDVSSNSTFTVPITLSDGTTVGLNQLRFAETVESPITVNSSTSDAHDIINYAQSSVYSVGDVTINGANSTYTKVDGVETLSVTAGSEANLREFIGQAAGNSQYNGSLDSYTYGDLVLNKGVNDTYTFTGSDGTYTVRTIQTETDNFGNTVGVITAELQGGTGSSQTFYLNANGQLSQ